MAYRENVFSGGLIRSRHDISQQVESSEREGNVWILDCHPLTIHQYSLDSDLDVFRSGSRNVTAITNSPSQDYTHPDDHNFPTYDLTPGFKPLTM